MAKTKTTEKTAGAETAKKAPAEKKAKSAVKKAAEKRWRIPP